VVPTIAMISSITSLSLAAFGHFRNEEVRRDLPDRGMHHEYDRHQQQAAGDQYDARTARSGGSRRCETAIMTTMTEMRCTPQNCETTEIAEGET
jgi:hypothetical protein